MINIDFTVDQWNLVLSRLNQSIINIVDYKGKQHIGVINPSVNDYLKIVFTDNLLELQAVRDSICNASQFERCYSKEELSNVYYQLINYEKVHMIDFTDKHQKNYFIASKILEYQIKNTNYTHIIFEYLSKSYCYNYPHVDWLTHYQIISALLTQEFYKLYSMDKFVYSEDNISNLLESLELDDLVMTINLLNELYEAQELYPNWFEQICKEKISESILYYFECVDTSEYCDNHNVEDLINKHTRSSRDSRDYGDYIDKSSVVADLEQKIINDIEEEVAEKLSFLEEKYLKSLKLPKIDTLNTNDIEFFFDSYFRDSYQENYERSSSNHSFIKEIEAIFER